MQNYILYNKNPKDRRTSDCVVRAIAKAEDTDWYTIYDDLCALGRKLGAMPNSDITYQEYLKSKGYEKVPIKVERGGTRPSVSELAATTKVGESIVIRVANHLTAAGNGNYYDVWDCGRKKVYLYWKKK